MIRFIVGELLHLANRQLRHSSFYALKDAILKRYDCQLIGQRDIQHIAYQCWECNGEGVDPEYPQRCWKCCGTGKYREFWVLLSKWKLGRRVFHRPEKRLAAWPAWAVTIEGHVRHTPPRWNAGREAFLWLALVYDRTIFRQNIMEPCRGMQGPLTFLGTVLYRGAFVIGRAKWKWHKWTKASEIPF